MAHIQYVDDLVREYMLFRGFSNSLKSFDADLKGDKDKSFRVDKIIDQITHCINTQDLQGLRDIWSHLDNNLFNKLEHSFTAVVKKLEQGVFKLYLVNCKSDKVSEFFQKLAVELHAQPEWKEWFFFPFCKNPEENPTFSVCYTKQWQDTLLISLHNFLATIFQCMPQPKLIHAETEFNLIKKLQEENSILRNRIQTIGMQIQGPTTTTTHQSRFTTFNEQNSDNRQIRISKSNAQTINDITSFDIPPPTHLVDDFYIIAQETGNICESQAKGLKSLIRNISSGSSPVLGRKESTDKKRSGSSK